MGIGKLYLCATPIGNMQDMGMRALDCLCSADVIACETVARAKILLSHHQIKKPLISYRDSNMESQGEHIVNLLREGKNVVFISDAGMPAVSDPGSHLVRKVSGQGLDVLCIPGPSAFLCAYALCGFASDGFTFLGFLPRKNQRRFLLYEEMVFSKRAVIFYEAPHRILKTLWELSSYLPDRQICVCRELTKIYEEVLRGTCSQIHTLLSSRKILGEFTVVTDANLLPPQEPDSSDLDSLIEKMIVSGKSSKEIAEELAVAGMRKKDIYHRAVELKNKVEYRDEA